MPAKSDPFFFSFYFLATTDLLFNLALVSRCITDSKFFTSIYFCQILAFLSHLAELLSACFTVHFTVQRFIAVRFPLSVFIEKNIHFLHYSIVTLLILLASSFCFALVKMNVYEYGCQESLDLKWFISDALSSFVVPFSLIAILNSLIIFHLRKASRHSQQLSLAHHLQGNQLGLNRKKKSSISLDSTSHSRIFEASSGQNMRVNTKPGDTAADRFELICFYAQRKEISDKHSSVGGARGVTRRCQDSSCCLRRVHRLLLFSFRRPSVNSLQRMKLTITFFRLARSVRAPHPFGRRHVITLNRIVSHGCLFSFPRVFYY